MKIVADDRIPFLKGVFEPYAQVVYLPGKQISKDDLLDADVLITRSVTTCNAALLEGTSVKLIATATIGDDHIDKTFCISNGIEIATAPGCNASAVEQYVVSALLTVAEMKQFELKDKILGIIGAGNVGSRVNNIARLLGMETLHNDPPRAEKEGKGEFVSLEKLLEESDIITLHVPLTYDGRYPTYYLAGESFFSKIKKPVVFINTSRGKVVDTKALKNAIQSGTILASIIDVWENEPDIDRELTDMAEIATPHIAGYSIEGKVNATRVVIEAVSSRFDLDIKWQQPELNNGKKIIEIDCRSTKNQTILFEVLKSAYNIMNDDSALRGAHENFEALRRNYDFRSEFGQYYVRTKNCNEDIKHKLEKLGFNID